MRTYADTSALVALYAREPAAASLLDCFQGATDSPGQDLVVSDWAVTEFASALGVKQRRGELDGAQSSLVWQAFCEACDGRFTIEPVNTDDLAQASDYCLQAATGLRAGDALHLAAAQRMGCGALLSLDETLNRNARASGMTVMPA